MDSIFQANEVLQANESSLSDLAIKIRFWSKYDVSKVFKHVFVEMGRHSISEAVSRGEQIVNLAESETVPPLIGVFL